MVLQEEMSDQQVEQFRQEKNALRVFKTGRSRLPWQILIGVKYCA